MVSCLGCVVVADFTFHCVVVVDHSGSMRKTDVPGFTTRTQAVYKCLSEQFLKPQLALNSSGAMSLGVTACSEVGTPCSGEY